MTDLRVFSPQADVVDPGALCAKVLRDVDGEVLNAGKTSDPGKRDTASGASVRDNSLWMTITLRGSEQRRRRRVVALSQGPRKVSNNKHACRSSGDGQERKENWFHLYFERFFDRGTEIWFHCIASFSVYRFSVSIPHVVDQAQSRQSRGKKDLSRRAKL